MGTPVSGEGDAALHEAARNALAAKLGRHRELGDLEFVRTVRQDGAGADNGILVAGNEDLAAGTEKVCLRIGELRFLRVLHEMILLEPRAIQLGEGAGVLPPKRLNLDVHQAHLPRWRRLLEVKWWERALYFRTPGRAAFGDVDSVF